VSEGAVPLPDDAHLARTALAVERLTLTEFRGYARERLIVDSRPVVLFGANGAGKTNLLEAVSYLAPGRGLRRARLGDVKRRDALPGASWAVAATLIRGDARFEIGTGSDPEGGEKRQVRIDGRASRGQVELADLAGAIWLTPAMDRLLAEGPSGRRRWLDRVVFGFDPAHAGRVTAYEKAMGERSRLLAQGGVDAHWLGALEEVMAAKGVAVAAARRDALKRLVEALKEETGPFPRPLLALDGWLEQRLGEVPALDAEEEFRRLLEAGRNHDAESGGASQGPHRCDLAVRHAAKKAAAAHCSTGEQKALLIALTLAQARAFAAARGWTPLVLLDEVAAHLDAERRAALFDALQALGAQSWATGTDPQLFAGLGERAQYFKVEAAHAAPVGPQ
jgi:DNA replication and repair protein RecF